MEKMKRILVPTDFSDGSKKAFAYAMDLAATMSAKVEVIHVWHAPYMVAPEMLVQRKELPPISVADLVEIEARQELENFLASVPRPDGVEVSGRILKGEAHSTIVGTAAPGEYDLIVMGTLGRTGFARLLLGSVAERVVRAAAIPVLTVRSA